MRMHRLRAGALAGVVAVTSVTVALTTGTASADTAARSGDIVGVGSDTVQNAADFLFDSYPGLTTGYNQAGNLNRVFDVFATGDANGRAVYDGTCGTADATGQGQLCANTTNTAPNLLPGSVILRDSTKPVTRPNGSGPGIAALISDATSNYDGLPSGSIQFARASRYPKATEFSSCSGNSACGGLHPYQIATDGLTIAHQASSYNGPASLSIDELYHIFFKCDYTKWNQIPGNTSGSADTIHPLVPQSGSGTLSQFESDVQQAEGLATAPTPGGCTRTVEEHDPTGIYDDPTPADAIEPFSTGKLSLINNGYFANGAGYSGTVGGTAEASGAYTPNYLTTTASGTAPDGNPNWTSSRSLYVIIRQADLTSTTPFQPGGSQNWAQALFAGGTIANPTDTADAPPLVNTSKGKALIAKAGFTPNYVDCTNNDTTGCAA